MDLHRSNPNLSKRLRTEVRALLTLGGPLVAAQLVQIAMSFVDTVMAGHLSPRDLAAVTVGVSLWVPIVVFGMGVLMSVSPTVAQDYGTGRLHAIGGHVRQGLWLSQAVPLVSVVA